MAPVSTHEFIPPGTRFHALPSPFPIKRGGALHGARIAYETWGRLDAAAGNAVLILTGLSPNAHAASSPAETPLVVSTTTASSIVTVTVTLSPALR